jgi:cobalt-precorrin-5B (C1)-methyltransferase
MKKTGLRYGFTTGACAAAAARGAALMLRDQARVDEVEIGLPRGDTARFRLQGQGFTRDSATCFVVKDAGDDPDVTNGAEIHAKVTLEYFPAPPREGGGEGEGRRVIIEGGTGIGRVTKPGLAVPMGEWAINPVPRKMIAEAVHEIFRSPFLAPRSSLLVPHVLITIPNGEELAKKTLNARLGIIGGLSILGTSGIVKPISSQAWTDTIDTAIDVARACGCTTLVLSTGRTSELAAQRYFSTPGDGKSPLVSESSGAASSLAPLAHCPLPEEAYIMMGDHVGHALRACSRKGVKEIVLAGQFAKLLKIACGHEQTHVSSSHLDLDQLAGWLNGSPHTSHFTTLATQAGTARELYDATDGDPDLVSLVCGRAARRAAELAAGCGVKVFLAGYGGEMVYIG